MDKRYKLYTMSDLVFNYYIEDTSRGKNCTKECVERKCLALMLCGECEDYGLGSKKYKFGTFTIVVRKDSDEIGMVYWTKSSTHVSKEQSVLLHTLYEVLGLTNDGQQITGPIDEVRLDKLLEDNNLSNVTEFKTNFLKLETVVY